jgi:hypothetical protein
MKDTTPITARADGIGITLIIRDPSGLAPVALGGIGAPAAERGSCISPQTADALLEGMGYRRTGPWADDAGQRTAPVERAVRAADPIRVRFSSTDDLARSLDGIRPGQKITAVFRDPDTLAPLEVTISLFQVAGMIGVGVYRPDPADGEPAQGAVVRWHRGRPEPVIVEWERPHCADDQCGKPCSHRKRPRSRS